MPLQKHLTAQVALLVFIMLALVRCAPEATEAPAERERVKKPNILIIVADDLGFADLSAYGSEIPTPRIDSLARNGAQFTAFYTAPACSPTRAMLLSGTDHHIAGVGTMFGLWEDNQKGKPGYEGYMTENVVSIATRLRDGGYRTFMTGKWHLGYEEGFLPHDRGFQRSFALLGGGASHFSDGRSLLPEPENATYLENGKEADLPTDFFSSTFYTDKMIEYIDETTSVDQPFFGYLAFTAPHWPLQAPDEYLERVKGRYDAGYDVLRRERLDRMKQLAIISDETQLSKFAAGVTPWDNLSTEQKAIEARKMEIYAAMVEQMDSQIGRLIDHLEKTGELDNTFILFFSDNGTEGNDFNNVTSFAEWINNTFDNSIENMGREGSYVYYGSPWAQAGSGPFRLFKTFVTEGGIRVPAIAHYPKIARKGSLDSTFMTVMDVAPTLLDLAGLEPTGDVYAGRQVQPMRGHSFLAHLEGKTQITSAPSMAWELFGRRAVREGDWKLVWIAEPFGTGGWQLYNLSNDPGELHDLADENPEIVQRLLLSWDEYAQTTQIVLPASGDSGYAKPPKQAED